MRYNGCVDLSFERRAHVRPLSKDVEVMTPSDLDDFSFAPLFE